MNRDGHQDVAYFIGPEVEHTPAYSKRTLFVVGKQDVAQIERMAREHKTPHIFMGANHSFAAVGPADTYWDETITALLDKGFWVTLDYQAHEHEIVLKMLNKGIWQSRIFVPMLSVRIPHVQTSSTNLTIKIDDIDFKATNAGVWCMNHHEITDSNRFTDWQDYGTDEVLAPLSGPVPNPVLKVPAPKNVAKIDSQVDVMLNSLNAGTAEINKPALNLEKIKEVVESDVKNDSSVGLDPTSPSQLRPENEEETKVQTPVVKDAAGTAEAYAEATASSEASTTKESPKKAKGKA